MSSMYGTWSRFCSEPRSLLEGQFESTIAKKQDSAKRDTRLCRLRVESFFGLRFTWLDYGPRNV